MDVNEELKLLKKCKKGQGWGIRSGGQGGYEQNIQVLVKMQKKGGVSRVGGVWSGERVSVGSGVGGRGWSVVWGMCSNN